MKNTVFAVVLALLAACGGQAESDQGSGDERIVEVRDGVPVYSDVNDGVRIEGLAGDIGQAAKPLLFAPSGTRQPGFTPGGEEGCIVGGGSAQNCVVPPMNGLTKGFVYYIEGGMGPRISGFGVARYDVYSQLNAMWADLVAQGAYTTGSLALDYRETFDLADPDLTYVLDVSDSGDFCSGSSAKGNVCFTGSTTGLSHDNSLVGTYHRMVNAPVIHIDYAAIKNKVGWTITQKRNALHQAIVLAFLKGIGQGPRDIAGSTRCDQNTVLTSFWCAIPPNAACKLNGWGDFGDNGFIDILGDDCGN